MGDERLRQYTKCLSDAVLGLRPLGGSECFMRVGDDNFADYRYFGAIIAEQRDSLHELNTRVVRQAKEIERLQGTLRYIAAQAKAAHHGALTIIQSNADAALDGSAAKYQAALKTA